MKVRQIDASLTGFTILMVTCLHVQHKNLWETQYNKLIYLQKIAKVQSDMNGHFLLNETKVILYLNWGFLQTSLGFNWNLIYCLWPKAANISLFRSNKLLYIN